MTAPASVSVSAGQSQSSLAFTRHIHRLVTCVARAAALRTNSNPGVDSIADDFAADNDATTGVMDARKTRAARTAANLLAFHQFTTPHDADVENLYEKYSSLAHKWEVFGHTDKARALRLVLNEVLNRREAIGVADSLNSSAIHHVLKFLFALSTSPDTQTVVFTDGEVQKAPEYGERIDVSATLSFVESLKSEQTIAPSTQWKGILAEDPLQGEHWVSVDYAQADDSDEDEPHPNIVEETNETFVNATLEGVDSTIILETEQDSVPDIFSSLLAPLMPNAPEDALLSRVLDSHFWSKERKFSRNAGISVEFDLNDPRTLAPSIATEESQNPTFFGLPSTTTNYIAESDIIREVLFCLSGLPGELFELDQEGKVYKPKMIATVRHLTAQTMQNILVEFATYGTTVRILQSFVEKFLATTDVHSKSPFSPSYEAFASVVIEELDSFLTWIKDLEEHFFLPIDKDAASNFARVVSVLELIRKVNDRAARLLQLRSFVESYPSQPVALFNAVHAFTCDSQRSIDAKGFAFGLTLLMRMLEPWFDSVQKWWIEGNLIGRCEGLGIIINDKVDLNSPNFWSNMLLVRKNGHGDEEVPDILKKHLSTVLAVGKCLLILREMNPENLRDLIPALNEGITSEILNTFSVSMKIPWHVSQKADSIETNEIPSQESYPATTKATKLQLFEDIWEPHGMSSGNILQPFFAVMPMLNSNGVRQAKKLDTHVANWCQSVMTKTFDAEQLWRPFSRFFDQAIEKVLIPKHEIIGEKLREQLFGECCLLAHFQTCQKVFLLTCGAVMGPVVEGIYQKV
ncbi:hypothetical protein HDU84_008856 [Entophlyctis sp. JEL0112]|nr:hypothetical protein HDU84_008856 [Entophlyctis sp. JEL0112]